MTNQKATDTPTTVVLEPINSERPSQALPEPHMIVDINVPRTVEVPYGFIQFQDGPVREAGVNGTSMEVVLKVIIERLEGYQRGPFPCKENEMALMCCKQAQEWLDARTAARRAQGVEGINQPHVSA